MSNYERMSTKKLNEIKSSLQGEELKTVENILAERQAKKDMAESNKITAEQAEQLIEDSLHHRVQIGQINESDEVEWLGGYITSAKYDEKKGQVYYNIKADNDARYKKVHGANLFKILDEVQVIEKKVKEKKDSKPREKRVFTQEQVNEILKEMHANVGKICVKNETEGRIVGVTLDKRSMMFMYKILTNDGKKIHCAYDKLNIGEFDKEGQQMQKNHVSRRVNMNSETAGMTKAEKLEYKLAKLNEQIAALQEQLAKEQAEKDMAKEERLD